MHNQRNIKGKNDNEVREAPKILAEWRQHFVVLHSIGHSSCKCRRGLVKLWCFS